MKTRVEFACRYWFPRYDRPVRYERGQRLPIADDWRWHRHSETMWIDIPHQAGHEMTCLLPAPFFTWSAASLQVLRFYCVEPGSVEVGLRLNQSNVVNLTPWRSSEMWTQLTFDPPGEDAFPHRGPWWLRYRTPDARDLPARMMRTVDAVRQAVDLGQAQAAAEEMRRELLLYALGGRR